MTDQIDAIELLLRDHESIEGLVEQLDAADDPAETRRLFLRIVEQLAAHEAVEQQVVFPAFRASLESAGDDTLAHRMGEHEELNELLAEMRSLAPDGFSFSKRESAFVLEIKEHFRREEETVFGRMRESFSADQLAELADRALAVKQHAPAFPDHDGRLRLPITDMCEAAPGGDNEKIERVAVPVNWTPESDRALVVAGTLARWAGVGVELVTVAEPIRSAALQPRLVRAAHATATAGRRRGELSKQGVRRRLPSSPNWRRGREPTVVHWLSRSRRPRRAAPRERTSARTSSATPTCPSCSLDPTSGATPTGRVMAVALDGTDQSESILSAACGARVSLGMTLRLLQVTGIKGARPLGRVGNRLSLRQAPASVPLRRKAVDYDILHGEHPAADIASYVAAHTEVGAVALATRGLSGAGRLLHGSTAFDVAHSAGPVPVLILHKV